MLFGSAQAVVAVIRVVASGGDKDGMKRRHVWLVYARWLVAGLTFQLAADIVGTSLATSWEEVARLAVIAVVRTLLSYFLDKEVENTRRPAASRDGGRRARSPPARSQHKRNRHGRFRN